MGVAAPIQFFIANLGGHTTPSRATSGATNVPSLQLAIAPNTTKYGVVVTSNEYFKQTAPSRGGGYMEGNISFIYSSLRAPVPPTGSGMEKPCLW